MSIWKGIDQRLRYCDGLLLQRLQDTGKLTTQRSLSLHVSKY